MSKEMKVIMENWRKSVITEQVTADDYVKRIKIGLTVLAAKQAGKAALKALRDELGPQIVDAGLEMVKSVPGVGNAISGITALWKAGKASASAIMAGAEVSKVAFDVLKLAADDYIEADDSKISDGNPLAVLFNIDDPMEVPLKPEFLNNFAGALLNTLRKDPNMVISDPDKFAEEKLAMYLNSKKHLKDAKPPTE